MDKTSNEYLNMTCPVCGNRFHLKPYAVKRFKNHYCSKKCHYEAKKEYMKGEKNHQFGLVGSKNDSWRGGTRITRYGYRLVQCIGHPFATKTCDYMFEHRLVAEKYLLTDENSVEIDGKLYLSPDYVVHHKNGNKLDNRVENLQVMTLSEHQSMHAKKKNKERKRDKNGRFLKENAENQ
jgi:hypothetical protein